MSRKVLRFQKPTMVFGVLCDHIAVGLDHVPAIGYFISGYDAQGELVLDRDKSGMAMVESPLGFVPMPQSELAAELYRLGFDAVADRIASDLDLLP